MLQIPNNLRPREAAVYIAYCYLNVKTPEELTALLKYENRSSVPRILKSLRKKVTMTSFNVVAVSQQ